MEHFKKTIKITLYDLMGIVTYVVASIVISVPVSADNSVTFAYDEAGRRVGREVVLHNNDSQKSSPKTRKTIMDELNDLKFTVYPNPTASAVNLIINSSAEIEGSVTIVNSSGAEIKTADIEQRMQFDLESHPRGIYFMVISYGEKSVTYKIIKE